METQFPFTQWRLETLPIPSEGRYQFRDAKMPGLCIRVTPNGTKTAYVYKSVRGRPKRIKLGRFPGDLPTVKALRDAARDVLTRLAQGEDVQVQREEPTLQGLFDYWMISYAQEHKKTYAEDKRLFDKFLKPLVAKRRLSTVRKTELQKLHAKVGSESGKYQANRLLELIRAMFNRAEGIGFTGPNPADGIKPYREQSRDRFLQADELSRFFAALNEEPNDTLRDFFYIALLTGARRGNVQEMQWSDLDLEAGVWRIPETKAGVPVLVPLVEPAVKILRKRLESCDGSPWVFPGRGKTGHLVEPKSAWKRILARAELQDVRIHDLRRTLGSWQVATGASLPVVGKTLGHTQPKTTQIYARLQLEPVRQAVEKATAAMLEAGGQRLIESGGK